MTALPATLASSIAAPTQGQEICFFSDDYLPAKTGTGVSVAIMARTLVERGHRVVVLTTRRAGEPASETIDGVRVYRLFSVSIFGFPQALATPRQIRAVLTEHRVRIAHFHYLGLLSLIGSKVARAMGLRCVFTHHMTVDHLTQPLPLRPFRPLFSWLIARFCEGMHLQTAPSRNFVERARARAGGPLALEFLSNALPTFRRAPQEVPSPPKAGEAMVFNVLFAGRLDREKNLPFLLRAMALAGKTNGALRLRIAGTGIEAERLKRLAAKLGLSERATFLGWLDPEHLAGEYQRADLFVLPSRVEAQAIVVLEAMSFGKPVIMSDSIVTATELVTPGENGFIAKSDDDQALADAICELANDPARARRMGQASRARMSGADFSAASVVHRLDRLYEQMLRAA